MAEKYLYGSLVAAFIWSVVSFIFLQASVPMLLILGPGILFVMLCYIIGLLKDIRAKLGIHEIGSEEKFFFEEENGAENPQSADAAEPENKDAEEN